MHTLVMLMHHTRGLPLTGTTMHGRMEKGRPTGMLTSSLNTSRMTPAATTSLPFWSNSKLDKSFMNTITDLAISADNAGIQWDS
jgi:hypothetical protein